MRDANLGWMCQRVLGREREGHGGCSQHQNRGQGISCRLPGPRGLGTGLACARCSCRPSAWETSGPHPCGHRERTLVWLSLPGASGQLGRCCSVQELCDGRVWPGRPSRLCRSATAPNYFSVCSIRARRRCCSAILVSASRS